MDSGRSPWFMTLIAAALLSLLHVSSPLPAEAESLVWKKTYNGGANGADWAYGVAVGKDGSVYVTGRTYVEGQRGNLLLQKYSPGGVLRWTRTYNGPHNGEDEGTGVAVAPDGSVCVSGRTNRGLLLQKYSAAGALLWTKINAGIADGVAVGADGSIYLVGYLDGTTGRGGFLRKYTGGGDMLWTTVYSPDASGRGVAVAEDGSVYVAGCLSVGFEDEDLLLLKYSAAGGLLWSRRTASPYLSARGYGVAPAPDGGVYVYGDYMGPLLRGMILQRFTPQGSWLWTRAHQGMSLYTGGTGVAVAADGGVYITGAIKLKGRPDASLFLRKFSPSGTLLLTRALREPSEGTAVAVAADGSVYVTGEIPVAGQDSDVLLVKYK